MTRSYAPSLFLLAAIWGASYLFIKVGIRELPPATLMTLRLLIAFPPLFAFLAHRYGVRGAARQIRAAGRDGVVLGILSAAAPFTLIAWGETHIDSTVAAIANASLPIFIALLAIPLRPSERVTGQRLAGVLVGLAGVGILVGVKPAGGWWAVAGTGAVIVASVSYALGSLYGQWRVSTVEGPVLAASMSLYGGLILAPFIALDPPQVFPGWKEIGSLLGLSLLGMALAQLILFRMLKLHGSSKTSLVTYLMPAFALFYGAVILNEPLRVPALAGFGLILAGVAVGSGVVAWRRRAVPA